MYHPMGMTGTPVPGVGANQKIPEYQSSALNSRVLGYLGRALSMEFSAAQHYLAQANLASLRHEKDFEKVFIDLANKELQHANLLINRMVIQGALPSGTVLRPASPSYNIIEALQSCEERVVLLINLYTEACQYCANFSLAEDQVLFDKLLQDEKQQLSNMQAWLQSLSPKMKF